MKFKTRRHFSNPHPEVELSYAKALQEEFESNNEEFRHLPAYQYLGWLGQAKKNNLPAQCRTEGDQTSPPMLTFVVDKF